MKQEDRNLSDVNYEPLNEEFYRATPHGYFVGRLNSLILQAGRPNDLDLLMRSGFSYKSLSVGPGSSDVDLDRKDEDLETYVALEAEVLYFHVIETLLRLYLAHEPIPICPWLEVARLREPREFKRMLERRFLSKDVAVPERRQRIYDVLIGVPIASYPRDQSHLLRVVDGLDSTLSRFADDFLSGAARYNAAKHGMAVRAEEQSLRVGETGLVSAEGTAIEYLEVRGEPKRWHKTAFWIQADVRMAVTRIATYLIQALWEIGRARYTGSSKEAQIFLFDKDIADLVAQDRPWSLDGFFLSLIYEEKDGTYKERTGGLIVSVFDKPIPQEWKDKLDDWKEKVAGGEPPSGDKRGPTT